MMEQKQSMLHDAMSEDVLQLLKFVDWILENKIPLCDKRCLIKDIDTEFGNVKSNYCERETCPDLILKLLSDNVRSRQEYLRIVQELLFDAIGLLINHDQHEDKDWKKDYEELFVRFNKFDF
ncbi:MAG: hypothetical protein PHE51_04840 [Eubacteriales bacterium]|nr:hypothetical protein [Eubacteriales bacterium]